MGNANYLNEACTNEKLYEDTSCPDHAHKHKQIMDICQDTFVCEFKLRLSIKVA